MKMRTLVLFFSLFLAFDNVFAVGDNIHGFPGYPVATGNFRYFFSADFEKPLLGVGSNLTSANVKAFTRKFKFGAFGLRLKYEGCTYSSVQELGLYYVSPFMCAGDLLFDVFAAPKFDFLSYDLSNAHGFESGDVVFANGESKLAFAMDAGASFRLKSYTFDIFAEDILPPNLALENGASWHSLPSVSAIFRARTNPWLELWAGSRYDGSARAFLPCLGANCKLDNWNIHAGFIDDSFLLGFSVPIFDIGKDATAFARYDGAYHVSNSDIGKSGLSSHNFGFDYIIYKQAASSLQSPRGR